MLPQLPLEIVLDIISSALPASPDVLLPAAHPTTRLLVTFALVCQETRKLASRYLHQHCVYLDSESRLKSYLLSIPTQPSLRAVASISLSPFCNDINNLPICSWVRELLCYTCNSLKKLVIDIPLRSWYPEDDYFGVRQILREGFESLVNLEEFLCTRDELFLDVFDHEDVVVWKQWPKLKRLALWNISADEKFWRDVALHPSLEMVVLGGADSLDQVDPKAEYFKHGDRAIDVVIFRLDCGRHEYLDYADADWEKQDPTKKMRLYKQSFTMVEDVFGLEELQDYIKKAAEEGTLWRDKYMEVVHPAHMLTAE